MNTVTETFNKSMGKASQNKKASKKKSKFKYLFNQSLHGLIYYFNFPVPLDKILVMMLNFTT